MAIHGDRCGLQVYCQRAGYRITETLRAAR